MCLWNHAALADFVNSATEDEALLIVNTFFVHESLLEDLVSVCRMTLRFSSADVQWLSCTALTARGQRISPEEARQYEILLDNEPTDLALRVLLLGYYFPRASLFHSERQTRVKHIAWLVENHPECAFPGSPHISVEGYKASDISDAIEAIWLRKTEVEAKSARVYENAAHYFARHNPGRSIELLKVRMRLDDKTAHLGPFVTWLYRKAVSSQHGASQPDAAREALCELERWEIATKGARDSFASTRRDFAALALAGNQLKRAGEYCHDAIAEVTKARPYSPEYSSIIHECNIILGRVALREGDKQRAMEYLRKAAMVSGCPLMESGGPCMTLAKELLEVGERQAVIEFIRQCDRFWSTPDHRGEQWIARIMEGKSIDFRENLWD